MPVRGHLRASAAEPQPRGRPAVVRGLKPPCGAKELTAVYLAGVAVSHSLACGSLLRRPRLVSKASRNAGRTAVRAKPRSWKRGMRQRSRLRAEQPECLSSAAGFSLSRAGSGVLPRLSESFKVPWLPAIAGAEMPIAPARPCAADTPAGNETCDQLWRRRAMLCLGSALDGTMLPSEKPAARLCALLRDAKPSAFDPRSPRSALPPIALGAGKAEA